MSSPAAPASVALIVAVTPPSTRTSDAPPLGIPSNVNAALPAPPVTVYPSTVNCSARADTSSPSDTVPAPPPKIAIR